MPTDTRSSKRGPARKRWNARATELFGLSAKQRGVTAFVALFAEHPSVAEKLQRAIADAQACTLDCVWTAGDGRLVDLSLSISPVFDDKQVLRGMSAIVRDETAHRRAARRFELAVPDSPVPVSGVPDLIAQMLDKLVANAADFARAESAIEVELRATAHEVTLTVRNEGPPLSPQIKERLFRSMTSVRPQAAGAEPHLGLGLYIVQLIADFHHAKVVARDRSDVEGVEVQVALPRLVSDPA